MAFIEPLGGADDAMSSIDSPTFASMIFWMTSEIDGVVRQ